VTDDDVMRFMRAVHDLGKRPNMHGRAKGAEIMQHMGLDPSHLVHTENPITDDDHLYRDLAQYCDEEVHYIRKVANGYAWVAITDIGERYVESGFMEL
jgi:hypothetical protein